MCTHLYIHVYQYSSLFSSTIPICLLNYMWCLICPLSDDVYNTYGIILHHWVRLSFAHVLYGKTDHFTVAVISAEYFAASGKDKLVVCVYKWQTSVILRVFRHCFSLSLFFWFVHVGKVVAQWRACVCARGASNLWGILYFKVWYFAAVGIFLTICLAVLW